MNNHVDELLQARAELHGIRAILRLLVMGETDVDTVDGLLLAERAGERINNILENISGGTTE